MKDQERIKRARDKAVQIFQHYFKAAFEAGGLKWNSAAVDLTMNAAILEAK